MNKGKLFSIGILMLLAIGLVIGSQGVAMAQDAKLIKLHSVGDEKLTGIFVDPAEAIIKKNTIVIWLSGVVDNEIKIEFADGKKCKSVTAHNEDFEIDQERWCYVTSYVPFASTTSLQFTDTGVYKYTVYTKSGIKAKGQIIVE